jgi:predicted nucleotidyltransferase
MPVRYYRQRNRAMKRSDPSAPLKAGVFKRLAALKPELNKLGIKSLAVFGSVARNRARTGSDIDLLVEFHQTPDLIEFAGVKLRLEELLGCSVDLVTRGGIHPMLRRRILKEAIRAA